MDNAQEKSAVAVEMATQAASAVEESRSATMQVHQQETLNIFTQAMRQVLTEGDEATKKLLIQKIPLLCTDILTMKGDIRDIRNDAKWQKWLLMGIVGGIGLLVISFLAGGRIL